MYGQSVLPSTGMAGAAAGGAGVAGGFWLALGTFAVLMLALSLYRMAGTFRRAEG